MDKALELASTLVVPAIATLLAAVFGPTLRTAARLRRDLASDAAIVESLRQDMGRRTLELIGYCRYPVLRLTDLLALAAFAGLVAYFVSMCFGLERHGWTLGGANDPFGTAAGLVISAGLTWTAYLAFHARWADRAGRRIRYLRDEVDEDRAEESGRLARIAWNISSMVGFFVVVAVLPAGVCFALLAWYTSWRQNLQATLAFVLTVVFIVIGQRVMEHRQQTTLDDDCVTCSAVGCSADARRLGEPGTGRPSR